MSATSSLGNDRAAQVTELRGATRRWLCSMLAGEAKMPVERVEAAESFEALGLDSILISRLNDRLEQAIGSIPKTLFFEFRSPEQLAEHLLRKYPDEMRALHVQPKSEPRAPRSALGSNAHIALVPRRDWSRVVDGGPPRPVAPQVSDPVAVIGLSGRYAGARDLQQFWENLRAGRESIGEIPADRWDWRSFHAPDPEQVPAGKSYCRWGGFLDAVADFDPLFFGISPKEAAGMDPQERLFLETAWEAIENAGYSRAGLTDVADRAGRGVGVFVGVTKNGYDRHRMAVEAVGGTTPRAFHWTVANRVSYVLNLQGPSVPIDTACSSSLTAIHEACQSLRRGECAMAIAGGVNLYLHPSNFAELCEARMLSSDGHCRSFGQGGDGFVPGEGVGAIVLKPLAQAQRDGDFIWGVLRGTAVNHGGKTNGFLVPNPVAQARVIEQALEQAGISARTVSYVEAHGTGTSLGDPIEVAGLSKAFQAQTADTEFCALGSVKSNIGHLEAAAGVAGVTKVVLQMAHKQIVPSLNCTPSNPNIDFRQTPFRLQTTLTEWHRPRMEIDGAWQEPPRRAGVSSFGAGGSNAHAVIEEGERSELPTLAGEAASRSIVVLSARDEPALHRYAQRLLAFLDDRSEGWTELDRERSLPHLAYTLQVGREAFKERLAIVASDLTELSLKLREVVERGRSAVSVFRSLDAVPADVGGRKPGGDGLSGSSERILGWWRAANFEEVAAAWAGGESIDWARLDRKMKMRRIPLPTYPFTRQRCWFVRNGLQLDAGGPSDAEPSARGSFFRPVWRLAEPPPALSGSREGASVIVAPQGMDGIADALTNRDHGQGKLVRVLIAKETRQIGPDSFEVDVNDPAGFTQPGSMLEGVTRVCVLGPGPQSGGSGDPLERDGGLSFFRLIKQLERLGRLESELFLKVVTFGVHDPLGGGRTNPWGASLIGLAMSLAREYPKLELQIVDVNVAERSGKPTLDAAVLEALAPDLPGGPSVMAIRDGRYFRRALEPVPFTGLPRPPLRRGGVYVIVGGAGGIGLETSVHLARRFAARVVVVGRRPEREVREKLGAIEKAGGQYLYCQADARDTESLRRCFEAAQRRFGAVHGVFHSAVLLDDRSISQMDEATFTRVLGAKMHTAVALGAAVQGLPLEFLLFYSSAQSFVGNQGQANYAAGCTFLDAYAAHLGEVSPFAVKNINWGYWGAVGVVATPEHRRRMARQGIRSLEVEEGMDAAERMLAANERQIVVLKAEPRALEHFGVDLPSVQTPAAVAGPGPRPPEASTDGYEAVDNLLDAFQDLQEKGERDAARLEEVAALGLLHSFRGMGLFQTQTEALTLGDVALRCGADSKWMRFLEATLEILRQRRISVLGER